MRKLEPSLLSGRVSAVTPIRSMARNDGLVGATVAAAELCAWAAVVPIMPAAHNAASQEREATSLMLVWLSMIFFGKPVSTFPGHALARDRELRPGADLEL